MRKLVTAVTVITLAFNSMCVAYPAGEHRIEIKGTSLPAEEEITAQDVYAYLSEQIPIIVTAARKEQPITESPSAITIITEEQIRQSGATNIPDILRMVAGMDILEQNSYHTTTGARGVSGSITNNVLVMQDGRELPGGVTSGTNWKELPLFIEDIKRIEIVKGPGSALYGTDAFNGIINIITKSPSEKKGILAAGGYGERNSQLYRMGYGGNAGKFNYSIMAGKNKTNGYGKDAPKKYTDRYDTNLLTGKFQYPLPKNATLNFDGGYLRLAEGFPGLLAPGVWPDDPVVEKHYYDLNYILKPNSKSNVSIRGNGWNTRMRLENSKTIPIFKGDLLEKVYTGEFQGSLELSQKHSFVGGLLARTGSFTIIDPNKEYDVNLFGTYLQYDFKPVEKLILSPGARYDHHSEYGDQVSQRISAVYLLRKYTSLRFAYNEAFRNPTPLELFSDFTFSGFRFTPNLQLNPEVIKSYEFGVQHRFGNKLRLAVDTFSNKITSRVRLIPTAFAGPFPIQGQFQNVNSEDLVVNGAEVQLDFSPAKRISGFANYAYQDVEQRNNQEGLSNRPFNKANFGISFRLFKSLSNAWLVHYIGKRHRDATSAADVYEDYTTTDVRLANGFLNNKLEVSIAAKNVFNKRHFEIPGFSKIGRTVTSQLSYKF